MPLQKQSGLEGVVTATRLSRVDGKAGKLILGGYALEEIAPRASSKQWPTFFGMEDCRIRQASCALKEA